MLLYKIFNDITLTLNLMVDRKKCSQDSKSFWSPLFIAQPPLKLWWKHLHWEIQREQNTQYIKYWKCIFTAESSEYDYDARLLLPAKDEFPGVRFSRKATSSKRVGIFIAVI